MIADPDEPLSFETDVKPLFRERDRESMQRAFDRLQEGTMPCDGAWPQAQVDLFRRWSESGKPS